MPQQSAFIETRKNGTLRTATSRDWRRESISEGVHCALVGLWCIIGASLPIWWWFISGVTFMWDRIYASTARWQGTMMVSANGNTEGSALSPGGVHQCLNIICRILILSSLRVDNYMGLWVLASEDNVRLWEIWFLGFCLNAAGKALRLPSSAPRRVNSWTYVLVYGGGRASWEHALQNWLRAAIRWKWDEPLIA